MGMLDPEAKLLLVRSQGEIAQGQALHPSFYTFCPRLFMIILGENEQIIIKQMLFEK